MTTSQPIRVLVVDDHAMVRRGLVSYLETEDDIAVVGEASDGAEAIRLCEALRPHVCVNGFGYGKHRRNHSHAGD